MRLNIQTYDQLRILSVVARRSPSGVKADDIASQLHMTVMQVKKLGARLVKAKLLQSRRGPHGGVRLTGSPSELKLGQLIATLEKIDGASSMDDVDSHSPMGQAMRQAFSAMVSALDEHSLVEFATDRDPYR